MVYMKIMENETLDPLVQWLMVERGRKHRLAKALGISHQRVYQWTRCPPELVLQVEELTGLSRHVLRPDIFGEKIS